MLFSLAYTLLLLDSFLGGGAGLIGPFHLEMLPNLVFNWLLGVYWLGYGLHCGTRRIVLAVSGQELHIELVSLFRDKRWHWPRQELASVRGDENGLCIRPTTGKSTLIRWRLPGSLAARVECRWLAELVWQRLEAADEPFGGDGRHDTLTGEEDEP